MLKSDQFVCSVMPVMIIERRRSAEAECMRPLLSLITNSDKELEKQGENSEPMGKGLGDIRSSDIAIK